jgi:peptide/nickel transport system permease protein
MSVASRVAVGRRQRDASRRFRVNPLVFIGGFLVSTLVVAALAAPLITKHPPLQQDLLHPLAPPSRDHWLGTDQLGRDTFSRLVYAARLDLRLACGSVAASLAVGTALGLLAGYSRGWRDTLITRIGDVISAIPTVVLLLALLFVLGARESSMYVAFAALGWVAYMRIVRAEVIAVRGQDYVLAARAGGLPRRRVMRRHILPNVISQALTFSMLDVVNVIGLIVFVGFVNLGIQPPTPEWGVMMSEGAPLLQTHWELTTLPGVAVVIVGLGFALIGDGLRETWRFG